MARPLEAEPRARHESTDARTADRRRPAHPSAASGPAARRSRSRPPAAPGAGAAACGLLDRVRRRRPARLAPSPTWWTGPAASHRSGAPRTRSGPDCRRGPARPLRRPEPRAPTRRPWRRRRAPRASGDRPHAPARDADDAPTVARRCAGRRRTGHDADGTARRRPARHGAADDAAGPARRRGRPTSHPRPRRPTLGGPHRRPGGHRRARRGGRAAAPRPPRPPARPDDARRPAPTRARPPDDDARRPRPTPHDDGHPDHALRPAGRPRAPAAPAGRASLSLVVLAGLVGGIVFGGQKLLGLIVPPSQDYTGAGHRQRADPRARTATRSATSRRTLVDGGVIASVGPFIDGGRGQPERHRHRARASTACAAHERPGGAGPAARPGSRLVSRVTMPEGLTVKQTLQRLADGTGMPLDQLQAAAADPAAPGPARLRERVAGGLPLPGHLRLRAGHHRGSRCCRRWSRGPCRRSTELQIPGRQRLVGAHRGQHRAGRGRLHRGHGQGRPGAGQPAGQGHAAAAGHHGQLRQRQDRPDHHRRGPGQPLAVQHLRAPGAAAGADQQPRRGRRCGRC